MRSASARAGRSRSARAGRPRARAVPPPMRCSFDGARKMPLRCRETHEPTLVRIIQLSIATWGLRPVARPLLPLERGRQRCFPYDDYRSSRICEPKSSLHRNPSGRGRAPRCQVDREASGDVHSSGRSTTRHSAAQHRDDRLPELLAVRFTDLFSDFPSKLRFAPFTAQQLSVVVPVEEGMKFADALV